MVGSKGANVKARNLIGCLVPVFVLDTIASAAQEAAAVAAPTGGTPRLWWIAPLSSVAALVFAWYFYKKMMSSPPGNETMESIASYVREGAYAYLFRQYKVVTLMFIILSAHLRRPGLLRHPEPLRARGVPDGRVLQRPVRLPRHEDRDERLQPNGPGRDGQPQQRPAGGLPFRRRHGPGRRRLRPAGHLAVVPHPRQARLHARAHDRPDSSCSA